MWIPIERKLTSDSFGQRRIYCGILRRKVFCNIIDLFRFTHHSILRTVHRQKIVQLRNKFLHRRNKLDKTFGYQYRTEITTFGSPHGNSLGNTIYNIVERLLFCFYLFRYKTDIRLSLQRAFQCDMGSRTSHQLDKVPIFFCGIAIPLNVSDYFGIYLARRIESERTFDHFVFQITIDGFRTTYHLHASPYLFVIFGQNASIGIGIVSADNDQCFYIEIF